VSPTFIWQGEAIEVEGLGEMMAFYKSLPRAERRRMYRQLRRSNNKRLGTAEANGRRKNYLAQMAERGKQA
jgi:hypothetical protein